MLIHTFNDGVAWRKNAFILPTIGLLAFGVLGYFFGQMYGGSLDEWPLRPAEAVVSSLMTGRYLPYLTISIAVGILLYYGLTFFKRELGYR